MDQKIVMMSYQARHQQQTNTPEYDRWLGHDQESRGDNKALTRQEYSDDSPEVDDWQTPRPRGAPPPANQAPSQGRIGRSDSSIQLLDSSHDMRQLPVAQVSPSIPPTPPTREQPSTRTHLDKDGRPRQLFSTRHSADGKYIGHGHMTGRGHVTSPMRALNQRSSIDQWGTGVDGLGHDPNDVTSNNFDVPHAEETINLTAFVPDMTLKPREKHHSGSPSRRRSSSVPPKKRDPTPVQQEPSPSAATYTDPSRVHIAVNMQAPVNVPSHQYQTLGPYDSHQSSHKIKDLTSWQRTLNQGQEDLIGNKLRELDLAGLHQPSVQYYQQQPPYGGIQDPLPPAGVGRYPDPRLDPSSGFSNTAPAYGTADYGGFERLIQAKDRILQEKDFVIQRQKMELSQLQEKSRQSSERHKLYPTSLSTDKSLDLLLIKLQEKDYENHRLQAQLAQSNETKKSELNQLNKELGKAEYEARKLVEREKDGQGALKKERDKLAALVKAKEAALEDTREKYRKLKDKYEHLKIKLQSVERHMERLPTADEYAKSTQCIDSLQHSEGLLKARIASLESTLTEVREVRREKESVIATLEERNADVEFEIQRLKTELGKMQQAMGAEDGLDPTSLKLCPRGEIEEITREKERLIQEVQQLKKVADSKHKQIRKLQSQHQDQLRDMERRLMQEEDCTVGLREEIKNREMDVARMKRTLKDLSDQNQELLSLKLKLQEQNHKLQNVVSSDRFKANQTLAKDLSDCVTEIQSLLQVCLQTAEGAEPNISMLLGVRSSSSMSLDFGHPETDEQAAQRVLEEVHQIRKDIDILRAHITDKYAEDVGNNCITH